MADIGNGYGSEWHLLRWLGRHRQELDKRVLAATGGERVEWLDFRFDDQNGGDRELRGVEFLPADHKARVAWSTFWPTKGNAQNWDAIGRVWRGDSAEWLLVEAKAHLDELASTCGADREKGGFPLIVETLKQTKQRLGIANGADWLTGYYQYANRLAVLDFLNRHDEPSRLLLVYFTGDHVPGRTCPRDAAGWRAALEAQDRHLGIAEGHTLRERVHSLFLPVTTARARVAEAIG